MITKHSRLIRVTAVYLLINFLASIFYPSVILALTSGPSSPEFSSFTPVSSTEMVNLFTGDFSYNLPVVEIPGPHGSGYALSLSYNSGSSMEAEASWVGFGWTLNPGSINRSLRGIPDEYNGEQKIDYFNKSRAVWTATGGVSAGLEVFSLSSNRNLGTLSLGLNNRINNYTGYQKSKNVGLSILNGSAGVNANFDPNGVTYSAYISPLNQYASKIIKDLGLFDKRFEKYLTTARDEKKTLEKRLRAYDKAEKLMDDNKSFNSVFQARFQAAPPKPFLYAKTNGYSATWSTSLGGRLSQLPIGMEVGTMGQFNLKVNEPHEKVSAYGYLHSFKYQENIGSSSVLGDYYVEKNRPFTPQHLFVGMPFSNYDAYSVSGEGVAGGFRPYLDQIGSFAPREMVSRFGSAELGFEVSVGLNVGIGLSIGLGYNQTSIGEWTYDDGYKPSFGQGYSYRFNNDLGGEVDYTAGNTSIDRADFKMTSIVPGFMGARAIMANRNSNRSSAEMFKRESKGASAYIHKEQDSCFRVHGKNGQQYVYGQPVFVRNETNLSVNVDKGQVEANRYLAFRDLNLAADAQGNYTLLGVNSQHLKSVSGSINPNMYATSYLLTEILTPEYVDLGSIGPSLDDFGGWTTFGYRKRIFSDKSSWYRYRLPYNGLMYEQNSISDTKDDVGVLSTGEKEIHYLEKIETKTHIAYFVTNQLNLNDNKYLKGSGKKRNDSLGAKKLTTQQDPAAVLTNEKNTFGEEDLEYLEKIVLYAKGCDGTVNYNKPLKTVHFEYDYNLVPNVANNANSKYNYLNTGGGGQNSGKLTLRKVWMEYEGIVNARISPYVFNYKYPGNLPDTSKLAAFYNGQADGEILAPSYSAFSDGAQNPAYEPYSLDVWGNLMPNGKERKRKGIPWIDQHAYLNNKTFDPAAYQLKSIGLPSGCTIHIQYESKDYAFVQNRNAMAMAHVLDPDRTKVLNEQNQYVLASGVIKPQSQFLVSVEDLGVDAKCESDIDKLVNKIEGQLSDKKIFYQFLYGLVKGSVPSLDNCRSDFITGYANFLNVSKMQLENGRYCVMIELGEQGGGEKAIGPKSACYDFVVNQRAGKLDGSDCVEPYFERVYDNRIQKAVDESGWTLAGLTIEILSRLSTGLPVGSYQKYDRSTVCIQVDHETSFFRLPVLYGKKGGGVRVKRLLLHDPGIESDDEVVLGTNYRYVLQDGITSSGVATNEPGGARAENPLVDFMPQKSSTWYEKVTAGENREQTEGPLGETLLPPAMVGYSRVVSENIHTGKTGTGFTVNEFFTTKDYYFDKEYHNVGDAYDFTGKSVDMSNLSSVDDWMRLPLVVVNYNIDRSWKTQGFRFIQTNMNGQNKQITHWNGTYRVMGSRAEGNVCEDLSGCHIISSERYEYFEPGERIQIMDVNETGQIEIKPQIPGKEMDIAMESKKIKDVVLDLSVEFDLSAGIAFPPPIFVGLMPSFSYTENLLATHATTKIISYPAILKKVTNNTNGIVTSTEHLAFSKSSGDAIVVKNIDSSVGGCYYSFNMPAVWFYKEMGQKAANMQYSNQLTVRGKRKKENFENQNS